MAQFDVHRNQGRTKATIPYLLIVQSNRIDSRHTTVVIPLVADEVGSGSDLPGHPDRHLNPSLTIEGRRVILHTTQVFAIPTARLGPQSGNAQYARSNRTPRAASLSMFGVLARGSP